MSTTVASLSRSQDLANGVNNHHNTISSSPQLRDHKTLHQPQNAKSSPISSKGKDNTMMISTTESSQPNEPDLCVGVLYKKRGGWGKLALDGWKLRAFVLDYEDETLYYYDDERVESGHIKDSQTPEAQSYIVKDIHQTRKHRGLLPLSGAYYYFHASNNNLPHNGQSNANPQMINSKYRITLRLEKQSWKLSAINQEEFDKWINALRSVEGLQERDFTEAEEEDFLDGKVNLENREVDYLSGDESGPDGSANEQRRSKKIKQGQRTTNNTSFSSTFSSSGNSLISLPFANTTGSLGLKRDRNGNSPDKKKKVTGSRFQQLQEENSYEVETYSGYSDSSSPEKEEARIAKKKIPSVDVETEIVKANHISMNTKPNDVHIEKRSDRLSGVRALDTIEGVGVIIFVNAAILVSRVATPELYTGLLILTNIVLLNFTLRKVLFISTSSTAKIGPRKSSKSGRSIDLSKLSSSAAAPNKEKTEKKKIELEKQPLIDIDVPSIGSTVRKGGTVEEVANLEKFESTSNSKYLLLDPSLNNTWSPGDHKNFKLRVGPNYKKKKSKDTSGPALYELMDLDVFKCDRKINDMVRCLKHFPDYPKNKYTDFNRTAGITPPNILVVTCQMPTEASGFFGGSDDGPTLQVVFYFRMTAETDEQLNRLATNDSTNVSPAVKLLNKYFETCADELSMRGRFKAMAVVANMADPKLNMPTFIQNYNGKPVLITKSATMTKGVNPHYSRKDSMQINSEGMDMGPEPYYEMNINVHKFNTIAKKGLNMLIDKFKDMVFEVGFTIEGREDDELPEVLLGVGRFNQIETDSLRKVNV